MNYIVATNSCISQINLKWGSPNSTLEVKNYIITYWMKKYNTNVTVKAETKVITTDNKTENNVTISGIHFDFIALDGTLCYGGISCTKNMAQSNPMRQQFWKLTNTDHYCPSCHFPPVLRPLCPQTKASLFPCLSLKFLSPKPKIYQGHNYTGVRGVTPIDEDPFCWQIQHRQPPKTEHLATALTLLILTWLLKNRKVNKVVETYQSFSMGKMTNKNAMGTGQIAPCVFQLETYNFNTIYQ